MENIILDVYKLSPYGKEGQEAHLGKQMEMTLCLTQPSTESVMKMGRDMGDCSFIADCAEHPLGFLKRLWIGSF